MPEPFRIGFHLTPFWSPTDRHPTLIIDEAIQVVAAASRMGYAWVSIGQHLLSHPTVWPQPFPMLARMAPETGRMRLKTSVLLLPIVNAVEAAENIATLDHICHGRLDVGVSIGYREKELETVGLRRQDRVPKLEESLALMKRLWAGDEVTFAGAYTRVTAGRMGFRRDPARGAPHRRSVLRPPDLLGLGGQARARLPGSAPGGEPGPGDDRRLARAHRRRESPGGGDCGPCLPREDVRHVPCLGDAGIDDDGAPARLRRAARELDGLRLAGRVCRDDRARPGDGPESPRLHDLQPAARGEGAHRLPPDDR